MANDIQTKINQVMHLLIPLFILGLAKSAISQSCTDANDRCDGDKIVRCVFGQLDVTVCPGSGRLICQLDSNNEGFCSWAPGTPESGLPASQPQVVSKPGKVSATDTQRPIAPTPVASVTRVSSISLPTLTPEVRASTPSTPSTDKNNDSIGKNKSGNIESKIAGVNKPIFIVLVSIGSVALLGLMAILAMKRRRANQHTNSADIHNELAGDVVENPTYRSSRDLEAAGSFISSPTTLGVPPPAPMLIPFANGFRPTSILVQPSEAGTIRSAYFSRASLASSDFSLSDLDSDDDMAAYAQPDPITRR